MTQSGRRVSVLSFLLPECHKVLREAPGVVTIHAIFTKSVAYGKVGIGGEGSPVADPKPIT
jgi:hypothetical protein